MTIEKITVWFESKEGESRAVVVTPKVGIEVEGGQLFRQEVKFLSDLLQLMTNFKSYGEEKA